MRSQPLVIAQPPAEESIGLPFEGWSSARLGDKAGLPFAYWLRWLLRFRLQIATFVLVVTVVAGLIDLSRPKQFDAAAILRVDPQSARVVGDDSGRPSPGSETSLLVTTEAQVVTSPAVVLAMIHNLGLGSYPEFAPKGNSIHENDEQRDDRLLRLVTARIGIDQPLQTYLLNIHFRAHDPNLAAAAANGLAQAFLDQEYATRAKALRESSRYMSGQLDGLRAQMEKDQTALVNYESANDVIDPNDKSNIYQASLTQMNTDLSAAVSLRIRLQAEDAAAQTGDVDALMVSDRSGSLASLHGRLLSDRRELARLGALYGARYPDYLQQARVVEQDQRALNQEAIRIEVQVNDEYRTAIYRENLIRQALNSEKQSMDAFNLRAVRYDALKASADSSTKLFYDLQQRIQDANVAAGLRSEDLRVISPARIPNRSVSPRPLLTVVVTGFASTLLAIGFLAILAVRDRTVNSPEQIEYFFGVPAIAALPNLPSRKVADEQMQPSSRSAYREAILGLYTSLQFVSSEKLSVIAVSSSIPGEGKSTTCSHLAAVYASLGTRVLLIDADMRKPSLHRRFRVPNLIGLSSLLQGEVAPEEALLESGQGGLTILAAGPSPANPSELLRLRLGTLVERLRDRFDVILIDCPPTLGFADVTSVATIASGVLLVVQAGATDQAQVAGAIRSFRSVRANLLGIVLNRVSADLDSYYSYYRSSYFKENDHEPASGEADD